MCYNRRRPYILDFWYRIFWNMALSLKKVFKKHIGLCYIQTDRFRLWARDISTLSLHAVYNRRQYLIFYRREKKRDISWHKRSVLNRSVLFLITATVGDILYIQFVYSYWLDVSVTTWERSQCFPLQFTSADRYFTENKLVTTFWLIHRSVIS